MPNIRVAVDVGGTFTDICILDDATKELRVEKTASTPDPLDGILAGIEQAGVDLSQVALFSHGTTVATNALITRRLPRTAMICTQGFRDVIEIRRGNKEDLWDTYKDVVRPYIPRRDRLTVKERTRQDGEIITPLDEEHARDVARILKRRGVAAIAVGFMNSYVNGANERRMKEILQEAMPDVPVSISSEVMPEIFEHERFSTTVANAALSPIVVDYTTRLGEKLAEGGYKRDLLLLHSGGGVMTPKSVKDFAARLAGSGIAAGAIASRHIAMLCGFRNSIGLDMGGTSTDVSLAYDGQSTTTKDWYVEYGYPIRFPAIEVMTIGAGGGSLAWQDEAGSLRNGPQSAGANPGPACYGNGNTQATNTDANVALGRLGSKLAGGKINLDVALASQAVSETVAKPFGVSTAEAAHSIIQVANANMSDAVRLISISRGFDPRDFALVAFGGAGALHGVEVARELAIPTVIVPPNPGVTSALGCLLVDIQHDFSESYLATADVDPADVESAFARLEKEALERLAHEGVEPENILLQRTIDMMYQGQWRSLAVSVPSPLTDIGTLVDAFHREHEREYNFRRDETPVGIFRINLKAVGTVPKADLAVQEATGVTPTPRETRDVWFDPNTSVPTPVFDRETLPSGLELPGPAVVEQLDSTVLIPPGSTATVDKHMNLIIQVEG